MRKFSVLIVLFLAGCSGNGNGDGFEATSESFQHIPEISNLVLSPDSALYMEGDGSVQVTVELSFTDLGQDIETLHVMMSDGTSLTIPISGSVNTASGTLAQEFDVTTTDANGCTVEIWLVDRAGQSSNHLSATFSVIPHTPEISNVTFSTKSVMHMDGGGSVVVTAEVTYRDIGRDIQTLWVQMPDGTSLEFGESLATETGTFTEDIIMSTETIGTFTVEFSLVDRAGQSSNRVTAQFNVAGHSQSSDWTRRASGLPYALNDVIWDGSVFIAVGGGGVILTSADGIDWVTRESGTNASLGAVAAHGSDIFAVGGGIVLLSSDHGETWVVKHSSDYIGWGAVAVTSSQVVVGGNVYDLFLPVVLISANRGDTWQEVRWPWGYFFGFFSDLIYRDEIYIAATNTLFSQGRAMVSIDGVVWDQVFYDEEGGLLAIVHDGRRYIVSGGNGTLFTSFDGYNWAKTHTLVEDADYLSGAWNGSKIVFAGGYSWRYYSRRVTPEFEVPIGISSTDAGETWDVFNIDGYYQSRGIAYGNGRFVSVGQSAPVSGEGAIYTDD